MDPIKVCRICLNTQAKMYRDDILNSYYKQLLNIGQDCLVERWPDAGTAILSILPSFICYECSALLIKSVEFQRKCMRSFKLLQTCIQDEKLLFYKVLSINRYKYKLQSNLGRSIPDSPKNVQHCEDILEETSANDDFESKIPISIVNHSTLTSHNTDQEFVDNTNIVNNENENDEPYEIKMEIVDCDLHFGDENDEFLNTSINIDEREMEPEQFIVPDRLDTLAIASENQNIAHEGSEIEINNDIDVFIKTKRKSKKDKMITKKTIKLEDGSVSHRVESQEDNSSDYVICIDDEPQIDMNKWRVVRLTDIDALKKFRERRNVFSYRVSKFKCSLCLNGFFSKANLNNHFRRHKNLGRKFACKICLLRFDKKMQMDKHCDTHFSEYYCLQCDFVTSVRLEICQHEELHNNMSKSKKTTSMPIADQQSEDA